MSEFTIYVYVSMSVAERISQQMYRTVKKDNTSDATLKNLRKKLKLDYEFYYFIKQRFYNLLTRIRTLHIATNTRATAYKLLSAFTDEPTHL